MRAGPDGALAAFVQENKKYGVILNWACFTGGLVIFNKWMLNGPFPHPVSLTLCHMVFCSTIAIAMYWAGKIEPIKMSAREYFATVFPVGFLYSMSLVCATSAYMLLSVSFVQMLKACMPVATFTMGCLFGTEVFSWPTLANMGVITLGVAIASYGEINAVFLGVVLQFGYIVTESLRLTLIQILLKSKGKSMNPFQTLLYVAPSCAACLLFPFFMWEAGEAHIPPSLILPLLANCCVAFGLNIAVYMLIGSFSALTLNISGIVKDFVVIALSSVIFAAPVTGLSIFGYSVSVSAIFYRNRVKAKEKEAKEQAMFESKGGDEEYGALRKNAAPAGR